MLNFSQPTAPGNDSPYVPLWILPTSRLLSSQSQGKPHFVPDRCKGRSSHTRLSDPFRTQNVSQAFFFFISLVILGLPLLLYLSEFSAAFSFVVWPSSHVAWLHSRSTYKRHRWELNVWLCNPVDYPWQNWDSSWLQWARAWNSCRAEYRSLTLDSTSNCLDPLANTTYKGETNRAD